jgi:hypothetical protein
VSLNFAWDDLILGENYELRADLNSEYADVRKDGVKRVSVCFEAFCVEESGMLKCKGAWCFRSLPI